MKKKLNIDTSISFLEYSDLINLFSRTKGRTIVSVHSSVVNCITKKYRFIYEFLIRIFYRKADVIVAVSSGVKQTLIDQYNIPPKKIQVIYNPFNVENIKKLSLENLEEQYSDFFNDQVIITVGRITKPKGQWRIIKALAKLKEEFPKLKAAVLGDGIFRDKLIEYSKDLGLENDVLFIPFQENPFKFISKASISALSSDFEGFSNVIVESLICGTPVVTTDCKAGPREILAPGSDLKSTASEIEFAEYGIITPFCDSPFENKEYTKEDNLLIEAIKKLLNDKELRSTYAEKGSERAIDFDLTNIMKEYEKII